MSNVRSSARPATPVNQDTPRPDDLNLDLSGLDDELRREIERLAAVNDELLHKGSDPRIRLEAPGTDGAGAPGQAGDWVSPGGDLEAENVALRLRVAELEALAQEALQIKESWSERQKEFEAILEEKSEVIRSQHLKLQEGQNGSLHGSHHGTPAPRPSAGGAVVKEDELLQLKEELERERSQLREDEEAMTLQMRQMEMAMAKERAELARQRNELQRLHQDITHEIETSARDSGLRERLQALQRRQHDTSARKSAAPAKASAPSKPAPEKEAAPAPETKKSSGFFRRLFGG